MELMIDDPAPPTLINHNVTSSSGLTDDCPTLMAYTTRDSGASLRALGNTEPKDIDQLAGEIRRALKRCTKYPESETTQEERTIHETLLHWIQVVHRMLLVSWKDDALFSAGLSTLPTTSKLCAVFAM